MAEPASYPGSPSLSAEAREKVLQTFRHTLEMARAGRNEDALLGCDFILKMDARFTPARRLLASLRGIATGTVVDLADFDAFGGAPAPLRPAPAPFPVPPAAPAAPPPSPVGGIPAPAAPLPAGDPFASPGSGLDGLGFGDLGPNPFAPVPPASGPAPAAPSFSPSPDFGFDAPAPVDFGGAPSGFSLPVDSAPAPDSFSPDSFTSATDSFASAPDSFASAPDPFASAPSFGAPDAFAPAPPAAGPGTAAALDPRISQFLRQGDEAAARGQLQEAIDLWSRVFLIDLSNEDASRRIDSARERQGETARQVDALLSEGIQHYEAGNLAAARDAFLKVLTISETDATARNYLNQIDAAPSRPVDRPAPAATAAADVGDTYLGDELESPVHPSFAEGLPQVDGRARGATEFGEERPARSREGAPAEGRGGKVDGRVLLGVATLVLVGVAGAAWFLFRPKPAAPPPATEAAATTPAGSRNPLETAQALFKQGKVEEALGILTAIPAGDPGHDQALILIDQFKSSAEPRPSTAPAVSEAQVDEARLAGLGSLSSGRYIDAVKSLDLVVRARPEDVEAAQALSRAREAVAALGSAIRSYNEQDYESAQRLLWDLRKQDPRNQDVEEYLFKSYFNDGVLSLQSGNSKKAVDSFREAAALRPQDAEAQRHLKFARRYAGGADDLLARIYVKHISPRP